MERVKGQLPFSARARQCPIFQELIEKWLQSWKTFHIRCATLIPEKVNNKKFQ